MFDNDVLVMLGTFGQTCYKTNGGTQFKVMFDIVDKNFLAENGVSNAELVDILGRCRTADAPQAGEYFTTNLRGSVVKYVVLSNRQYGDGTLCELLCSISANQ